MSEVTGHEGDVSHRTGFTDDPSAKFYISYNKLMKRIGIKITMIFNLVLWLVYNLVSMSETEFTFKQMRTGAETSIFYKTLPMSHKA